MRRGWGCLALLAALLSVSLWAPAQVTAQPRGPGVQPKHAPRQHASLDVAPHDDSDKAIALRDDDLFADRYPSPLLVSLLDGSVAAVDEASGRKLWTYDTGAPLVSNKGVSVGMDGAQSTILPGADGSLYAYRHGEQMYEILAETIEDLVDGSPGSLAFDGSLLLGAKDTTLYVLDAKTGRLVEEVAAVGGRLLQVAAILDPGEEPDPDRSPGAAALASGSGILVARSNWHVHALARGGGGGVRWNVTFGRVQQLSLPALRALVDEVDMPFPHQESPGLLIGAQNSLLCYDPCTRLQRWSVPFDSPLVAAFPGGSAANMLPGPHNSMPDEDLGRIWVGQLPGSGGLYALPASYYEFDFPGGAGDPCHPKGGGGGGGKAGNGKERDPACEGRSLPASAWDADGRMLASNDSGFGPGVPLGAHEVSAATQAGLALPAGRGLPYGGYQYRESPPRLLPATVDEEAAWAAGYSSALPFGWSWKGLIALILGVAAVAGVLAGVVAALTVLLLARRRDAANNADRRQPPLAQQAGGSGSVATQVGRETAEQFANADGNSAQVAGIPHVLWLAEQAGGSDSVATQVGRETAEQFANADGDGTKKRLRRRKQRGSRRSDAAAAESSTGPSSVADDGDLIGSDEEEEANSLGSRASEHSSRPLPSRIRTSSGEPSLGGSRDGGADSRGSRRSDSRGGDGSRRSSSAAAAAEAEAAAEAAAAAERQLLSPRSPLPPGVSRIGRMEVGTRVLGYGSGGTVVLEGRLDGRPVAVKRLLARFAELARTEINALIHTDDHPNVVRCFSMERDAQFVYLALERCAAALHDVMEPLPGAAAPAVGGKALRFQTAAGGGNGGGGGSGGNSAQGSAAGASATGKAAGGARSATAAAGGGDGTALEPTPLAWAVARDIGEGLAFLHTRGFVHRDLKPHNVLLAESGRAKVSDMGLCTRLHNDASSFETPGAGGSQGWQAYEQLVSRSGGAARQSRAVDVFSYGLLLHYCLTGGRHPFGARYERDMNILQGRFSLEGLKAAGPEAANLVGAMLRQQSAARPPMAAVLAHPAWWAPAQKLAFLVDLSNAMEFQDRAVDQSLLNAFEACGPEAFGAQAGWGAALSSSLMHDLSRYRDYRYTSLRDLLRVVRNKRTHFYEMPPETQAQMGPLPDGFLRYFQKRFPRLFLTCYAFALARLTAEPALAAYFPTDARELMAPFFADSRVAQAPAKPAPPKAAVAAAASAAAAMRPRSDAPTGGSGLNPAANPALSAAANRTALNPTVSAAAIPALNPAANPAASSPDTAGATASKQAAPTPAGADSSGNGSGNGGGNQSAGATAAAAALTATAVVEDTQTSSAPARQPVGTKIEAVKPAGSGSSGGGGARLLSATGTGGSGSGGEAMSGPAAAYVPAARPPSSEVASAATASATKASAAKASAARALNPAAGAFAASASAPEAAATPAAAAGDSGSKASLPQQPMQQSVQRQQPPQPSQPPQPLQPQQQKASALPPAATWASAAGSGAANGSGEGATASSTRIGGEAVVDAAATASLVAAEPAAESAATLPAADNGAPFAESAAEVQDAAATAANAGDGDDNGNGDGDGDVNASAPAAAPAAHAAAAHAAAAPGDAGGSGDDPAKPLPPPTRPASSAFAGGGGSPERRGSGGTPTTGGPEAAAAARQFGGGGLGNPAMLGSPKQSGMSELDEEYLVTLIPNDLDIGSPGEKRPKQRRPASAMSSPSPPQGAPAASPAAQPTQRQGSGGASAQVPQQKPGGLHALQGGRPPLQGGRPPPPVMRSLHLNGGGSLQGGMAYYPAQQYGYVAQPVPHHVAQLQQWHQHQAQQHHFLHQQQQLHHQHQQQQYSGSVASPPALPHQQQNDVDGGSADEGPETTLPEFPARPGHPVCDFYQKTGHCKYGEGCKFDHPAQYAVRLNRAGLPLRPGEPMCSFYAKKGECKFGPACKFDHPIMR